MSPRISFKNVTVDIPIYDVKARSLKHTLFVNRVANLVRPNTQSVGGAVIHGNRGVLTVRALDAVNFDVTDGDRVAFIGHNGAGKTTFLRVAAGIYEPTTGEVDITGRVMTLFNIMEGILPDATGIEMIHTRATLLGMSQDEIRERIDEVTSFCDLGEYIDMPVRTYSTGMLMRLAFAITTAVDSDVLIMDEIIGTGDAAFFERAEKRMRDFVERSRVLLLATHSPEIVRKWCNKAVLFHHGRIQQSGDIERVLETSYRLNNP